MRCCDAFVASTPHCHERVCSNRVIQHVPGEAIHAKNTDVIEEAHASSSETATEYVVRVYTAYGIYAKGFWVYTYVGTYMS